MSKRQLNSRIKNLFAELGEESLASQQSDDALLAGWTWNADERGYTTSVSAEIIQFLGYPPENFIGQPVDQGLDSDSAHKLKQALKGNQFPVDLQLQYFTYNGDKLATNVQLYPFPWQPDEPFRREAINGWRAVVSPSPATPRANQPAPKKPKPSAKARPAKTKPVQVRKITPSAPVETPSAAFDWNRVRPTSPLGYKAENHHIQPSAGILTELGRQSLEEKHVVSRPTAENGPAVMALSTPRSDGESSLLLELLDEEPGRKWNDAERMLVEQVADQMSLALENAQLFQQTQNALAATSALYAASAAFSAAQSYSDILDALRQHTLLGQADTILAIHYFNDPWSEAKPAERSEILSGWSAQGIELKQFTIRLAGQPEENQLLDAGRITVINNLPAVQSTDELLVTVRDRFHVNNLVLTPLVTGGQWLGFISAGFSQSVHFSPEEERRLIALSGQAAIAINNLRLLAETRQRNLELAAINSVIAAASRSLALEEMLSEVLARVLETVDYSAGLITLVDADGELKIALQHEMPPEYIEWLEKFGLEGSLSNLVFKQRLPIKVSDLNQNSPIDATSLLHFGLHSFMGVPLESKGLVLGTISVFGAQPKTGEETRLPLLQAIGQQVAVAVENASLFKETQKRSAELAVINRVVAAVAGSKDLQTSLGIIASELGRNLQVQTGIALLNEERQVMTVVASYTPIANAPDVIGVELPVQGNPSTQQVLATRKTLVIDDAQQNPLTVSIHAEMRLRSIQSLMLIPLIAGNRVIGTVGLDILEQTRKYKPDEIRLAETIVLQASTAIQNTRLFEQTEQALAETETLYKASAEFNETQSYAGVLDILRRYTMIGRRSAINMLALFEEPHLIGYGSLTIPEWYKPIAAWSENPSETPSLSRSSTQDLPAAGELMKPDAPSIIFDVEDDLRLDYPARQIYTQRYHAKSMLFAPLGCWRSVDWILGNIFQPG